MKRRIISFLSIIVLLGVMPERGVSAPKNTEIAEFLGISANLVSSECPQKTYNLSLLSNNKVQSLTFCINAKNNEKRCEVAIKSLAKDRKPQRIRADIYQPSSNLSAEWYSILQIHSFPDKHLGEKWRCPPLSFEVKDRAYRAFNRWDDHELSITSGNNCTEAGSTIQARNVLGYAPVLYDVWQPIVIDAILSPFTDGRIRMQVGNHTTPVYKGGTVFNDTKAPYLKLGIYKPAGWTREEIEQGQKLCVSYRNISIPRIEPVVKKSPPPAKSKLNP